MNTRECSLGPIHLVLYREVWQAMPAQKERFARWPARPADVAADLRAFEQGVPTLAQPGRGQYEGQKQLLLCTPTYYFLAVPSDKGDAYFVPWMQPLGLREHERLARGALLLKATGWHVHTGYDTIPPNSNNAFSRIWNAWQSLQNELKAVSPPVYTLTSTHESYLNTLDKLIEVTRQLVHDRAALESPIGYRQVEAVGEVRQTARDIYAFQLVSRAPRLNQGDYLRLRDIPDLRGRVSSLENNRLSVKFETPVDRRRIPEQGVLERTESDKPFRIQQAAVDALRAGEAKNPHLLPILIDGDYQFYHSSSIKPGVDLNPAQAEAFQRSLTVPDLLLVLGPPGTGKTQTIAEIVRQHGLGHRRVLITAKTHKAVDNVLERVLSESPELILVRIGHEDRVSESSKDLLIDTQARTLQAKILDRTEAHAKTLGGIAAHMDEVERFVERFSEQVDKLEEAGTRLRDAERELEAAEEHIKTQYGQEMQRLHASLRKLAGHMQRLERTLANLTRRQAVAQARRDMPLLGPFWAWRHRRLMRRISQYQTEYHQVRASYDSDSRAFLNAFHGPRRARQTPEYLGLEQRVREAYDKHQATTRVAAGLALRLDQGMAGLVASRPPPEPFSPVVLRRYLAWFRNILPLLQRRYAILDDWRTRLESRTEELYPVIIRFADAVGATCIGVATDPDFEDVDFDLVVADEAGQIGLPDLLVPLVRAERALLVGDHHQLPPFVENEVQGWLETVKPESLLDLAWVDEEGTEAEAVTSLLTQSAFESLFPKAEESHVVRLDQQYRMPQAIADFAADCFYEGRLETMGEDKVYGARHDDPFFKKPLVFVDTSALPLKRRQESSPRQGKSDPESWGMTGYVNDLEARLIADIVTVYDQERLDWVVIVPYRAQAQLIRRKLARKLPAAPGLNLDERVATVDSFQGGECNRVIYGFTRSNDQRKVGFLRELRRLNVAMTRARQQLVLVGDLGTLTRAKNEPFRDMVQALKAHVQRRGELLSYDECQARLASRRG